MKNRLFSRVDLLFSCFSGSTSETLPKDSLRTPQRYTIGGREIQEEKLLSEGGYGYIWKAYDIYTKENFALKKMICQGPERTQLARNEMDILKKLPPSENIMRFYDGQIIPTEDGVIAIFLLEFCSGGSIFDLMVQHEKSGFSESQVITMIKEIAKGLRVMHTLKPPVAHRDIKIENVLINNGRFKLCDFGSCSSQQVDFSRIEPSDFYSYEEFYERNTTLMYRPPEMSDLYLRYEVNTKVDIWMLGCVLYTICFFKHPFQDASKLAISTAKYIMPKTNKFSDKVLDFIRHMLTPNPKFRPDVHEIIEITEKFDALIFINLNPLAFQMKTNEKNEEEAIQNFEKTLKPLKKFDGDIPMEELMNLKKKIENEGPNQGKARPKKPAIPNPRNIQSSTNNDWNEVPANKSKNFSGFEGFNNNNTQVNNTNPQPQANFSNFGDWKNDKKPANVFNSFDQPANNSNAFSAFENNFNFNSQKNNNNNTVWNNNNNSNNFQNRTTDTSSNFDKNFGGFNNNPAPVQPSPMEDYSQFFAPSNNVIKPNPNPTFPPTNQNPIKTQSGFTNNQPTVNTQNYFNNNNNQTFDNFGGFNNQNTNNNAVFNNFNNSQIPFQNPPNQSPPKSNQNTNNPAVFNNFNNSQIPFQNPPNQSPPKSSSPLKNQTIQSQTIDLIGMEEVQTTQKTHKPINLLEDLGSISFN